MIQVIQVGIFLMLLTQLDKLARHNRQGSYRTRERYYEAFKRFCAFLADTLASRNWQTSVRSTSSAMSCISS